MITNQEPNYATYVERITKILQSSALIFPNKIGGDEEAKDLLNGVYQFQPPVPENPDGSVGPPHAFVTTPDRTIFFKEQTGRDNRDEKGPQRTTLEFYIVVITLNEIEGRAKAESDIYAIISAIKTTLAKNIRLCEPADILDSATRLASTLDYFDVPYILPSTNNQTSMIARNVVVRPIIDTKFTT